MLNETKKSTYSFFISTIIFMVLSALLYFLSVSVNKLDIEFTNKLSVSFLILCFEYTLIYFTYIKHSKSRKIHLNIIVVLFFMFPLLWNYCTGVFVSDYDWYKTFQGDSERLVTNGIVYKIDGREIIGDFPLFSDYNFFLDTWNGERGIEYYNLLHRGIHESDIIDGYSNSIPGALAASKNNVTDNMLYEACEIEFNNGDTYSITGNEDRGRYVVLYTDADYIFTTEKNGSVLDVKLKDNTGKYIRTIYSYYSQYGLQGKVFQFISKLIYPAENVFDVLGFICCVLMALCVVLICALIRRKYNMLMSVCFYVVFFLSPWNVNYSNNLYWVEFTWFIPMLIGLYAALNIDNKKSRIASYILTFFAILIKSLCGYEYISTIMISLMLFIFTDFIVSIKNSNKSKQILYFKTMVLLGVSAVSGFISAVLLHTSIYGNGSVKLGIQSLWETVLIRTLGSANKAGITEGLLFESMNASICETVIKYFKFDTDILYGIDGKWFLIILMLPIAIFIYDIFIRKSNNLEEMSLYLISFAATISWFVLGKSHSYIHLHMNYVLWYFGFVQICIYIPLNRLIQYIKQENKNENL